MIKRNVNVALTFGCDTDDLKISMKNSYMILQIISTEKPLVYFLAYILTCHMICAGKYALF